jgi:hypothetical protein
MKNSLIYKLAIATSLSVVAVSCTPSTPTVSTTPSATVATTPSATPKPSDAASPTSSATPSASAKPSESPSPTSTTPADSKTEKVPDTVRVAVINNSGKVLKAIYMSAPKKQDWGENELDTPVPDREKADFEWKRSQYKGDDAGCIFDIRAEYSDGKSAELDPIDVCKTPAINLK